MPVDKLTIEQFAQKVKAKYPEYKDVNDSVLVEKMVAKYPEYKDRVSYSTPPSQSRQFKPMTDWLSIPQGYQPMVPGNDVQVVDGHVEKVAKAKQRISDHISDIDNSVHDLIYNNKKDLQGRIVSEQLGLNPKEIGPVNPQAQQLEAKLRQDIPVTPQEIEGFKSDMGSNQVMTRQALNQKAVNLSKTDPLAAKQLKADIYRLDRQDSPEKESKVDQNIDKIKEGEFDYDVVRGQLVKPEGFFGSLVTGFKDKVQAFDDAGVYESGDKKAMLDRIKERLKHDPDKAIPVPEEGWLGMAEMGRMAGGQPLKPLIGGGAAGLLLGPEAGAAASSLISVPEMYRLTLGSALPHNYEAVKKQEPNLSDDEALDKALELTHKQAAVDAASGAAMGALGAKVGFSPTGLKAGLLQKSLGSALKQIGQEGVKKAIEGVGVGSIGAAGQYVKNIMAQKAGIPTDSSEGMAQQLWGGVQMTMAMTLIAKAPELLKPKTYTQLLQSIKDVPKDQVEAHLSELEQSGQITPEQSQSAQKSIEEHQAIDNSIKPNVPESDRLKVHELIKERNELEASLETEDKAYHAETKEKIKKLNDRINAVSKGEERGELQKLVDEEYKSGNLKGYSGDFLRNSSESVIKRMLSDIADQAHDPNTAKHTIETFGQAIVDKAKELYPKEATKESKISVIQPGERKQTEAITNNDSVSVGELLDKEASYKGQKGMLYQDGQTVVFKVKGANREYEIGNIEEVKNSPIGNYGIEHESSVVNVDNEGNIVVRGNSYKNNYSDPLMAINRDGDGNVVSVNLETTDGQKRTFRGNIAEDIAYNISLKEINKNNETRAAFEDFINSDEPAKKQIEDAGLSATTKEGANESDAKVQRTKIKSENVKTEENAIPVESSNEISVGETSGDSQPMGEGVSQPGEAARTQETGAPSQESAHTGIEGLGDAPMVGITHAQMDIVAENLGLPKYEGSPETFKEWDEQAAKRLANDPNALPDLFNKLRNGLSPDPVETRMMVQYWGDLMGKIDRDPYNTELQNQVIRTKDLFNISGRLQGKQLVARKGLIGAEDRLGDFLIRDTDANRAPLTEDQTKQAVKEYQEIKAAKDALDDKVSKLEAANAKLKAEKEIAKVVNSTKKESANKGQKRDFAAEREKIINSLKQKWDASRGKTNSTFIPYADRLVEISPDVARLIKVLVEEGIDNLPDLVAAAHDHLKKFVHGITEKDVHDLIAGEYNKPKQTKNEINEKIFNLRTEAKFINRLEELESGVEPKNDKERIKRSREVEALRKQIKEHDLTKLSAYKARIKNDIAKLQEQLRSGQYSEPKKPEIKLDAEGLALKDELIKLKQEREKRLAQIEYENRTNAQKAIDAATNVLNIPRTLMASADLSAPLRQGILATVGHPVTASKAFVEMLKQATSQKNFDRWLIELKESPEYKLMEDAGLYIADPNNLHLQQQEESFMTNLPEKIPLVKRVVKGSERGYVAYLNKMRADLFNQGADVFAADGRTFENSPELYKGLATFINNATGRGGLGPLDRSAQVLNTAFFSPRLIASRLNLINPVFYIKLPKEVRLMALKDMGKLILFGGSILGLAKAAGAQVEEDPRSSDFGKIKVGNTRWDIWGGFQQYIRIIAQLYKGQTKSSNSGEIYDLKGDKFPYKTRLDQLGSFFRGKLAPVPGFAVDALSGKNVVGESVDLTSKDDLTKKAYELFVPMIAQDIQDAWKEQGAKSLLTVGVPSSLGIGVTTYGEKEKSSDSDSGSSKHKKSKANHISHKHN